MTGRAVKDPRDKWILIYFVMFFAVIAILDSIFVYLAVSTHTGVVTDQAYERGLAFDELVEKAESQPAIVQNVEYKDGVLRWVLSDEENMPIENAEVNAKIVRPVHGGHDFDIRLQYIGEGMYESALDLPLKGAWRAKLSSKWDNGQYQTTYDFLAK